MFDAQLRPLVDRVLDPVGALVARTGVTANQISFAGFALGLGAAVAVAFGAGTAAVLLIIANRLLDGLDGAVARSTGSTDLGAYLDITLDFLFYSAVPFAFAVADPANATAAAFLIFSFVGTGSSFLAFAIIAQKRGISTEIRGKKGFFYLGGLTEGSETIIFLLVVAFWPDLFVPLAWVFGCLCWITTVTRVRYAIDRFSDL
ncbi:MAG: CDP-alcohol phosphatidyltransferase family protein [Pseudomonadota bacterium]|nr:CDP-alcohol phosphatidyltransferase family protein [Pseudomonadota bacterium]MEC8263069.1 CDP-alcohol phosphatidyltransferase family protein [Pseudomonadota bacterium]